MAVAVGVWAGRGVAATSTAAARVRVRVRVGVLQNVIGSLLAIAYDRIKVVILLKPEDGLNPISCHAVLERSTCAPFIKERRMECINATSLHRKSGQMGHPALIAAWDSGMGCRYPTQAKGRLEWAPGVCCR